MIIGFGTAGRVAFSAVRAARQLGLRIGLLRPITLSPFPVKVVEEFLPRIKSILVVEMNAGQMLEDVRLAVQGRVPVEFYGRLGGVVPFPGEILSEIRRLVAEPGQKHENPREAWLHRMLETA